MPLYHCKLGLPTGVRLPYGIIQLVYGIHSKQAKFGRKIEHVPEFLDTSRARIIEVETENGKAIKVVYRTSYDARHDIIIVVAIAKVFYVKTVWLNEKGDEHKTLNTERYVKCANLN